MSGDPISDHGPVRGARDRPRPMSGDPVALGLVGCGKLAEAGYLPALAAAGVRLVAVADPDPDRRDLAGRTVAGFPNAAALLDEVATEVDGLILASPAATHVADAALAAEAGVVVLVEKPPAVDAAGAAALAAIDPSPWVAFNRRFDPGVRAVREQVPADGSVELNLAIRYRRRSWGAHSVHDDALLDLGPHLVDLALWLGGGRPVEVSCTRAAADRATLELASPRGRSHLQAAADQPHRELIELRSDSGALLARRRAGGLPAAVLGRLLPRDRPHPLVVSLTAQVEAFAAAIRDDDPGPLGTAADGHAVMQVLDAARESAERGGHPVPVPHPAEAPPCS